MSKVHSEASNDFCPQTLFLYGTYSADGSVDFGEFCWFSYTWDSDKMGVMCCIGGDKLTKENIMRDGVFSANLVTRDNLPFADFCGNHLGGTPQKAAAMPVCERGEKLCVPILAVSPVCYELSVIKTVELDGSTLFVCRVENTLMEAYLADASIPADERLIRCAPVKTTCAHYYGFDGSFLGEWGKVPPTR